MRSSTDTFTAKAATRTDRVFVGATVRTEASSEARQAALVREHLAFLDWPELLERLAEQAQSGRGAAACRGLALASSVAEARERLADLAEMVALVRAHEPIASFAFPDIEPHLDDVEKGVPLGAEELKQVAAFCETVAAVRRFFARPRMESQVVTPRLSRIVLRLGHYEALVAQARDTFDATGELRDSASPELLRLRRERDQVATHVRARAEEILHSESFSPFLQDQFVTLREDRFVLPVRASFKSMGLGIVHDTSGSGETVFIEPTALVELNNRLKVTEIEIRRESRRILEELAAAVAAAAPNLREDRDTLAHLDRLSAGARLAMAYEGEPPEVVEEPVVELRELRHPLLALRATSEHFTVAPNDVALGEIPGKSAARVLVISGPNAGGKTVLLKAVGLSALLARAGLYVPAAPGSRVGFFDRVLADIGDQQSILGDLSTFSAHLANIAAIVDAAAPDSGQRVLVLCDELMAGTHPEQGAALARATLERLATAPGLVITTTHYDSLKGLTEGDTRFRNAGMEFDLKRLRPTFKLRDGVPGRSYALDIAARMGLPEAVLARARELVGTSHLGLEEVLRKLEDREQALTRSSQVLEEAKRELEEARDELRIRTGDQKAAAEALNRRERELAVRSREAIDATVRQARESIAEIVREVRRVRTVPAADAARQALDKAAKAATETLPAPPPLDVDKLRDAFTNRALGTKPVKGTGAGSPPPAARKDDAALVLQNRANTVDLRGMRADDALRALQEFLDRTVLEGAEAVFVIHGHGTGALRKVVREYLATSPYVERFRPGGPGEGGDGVSILSLKA